MPKRRRLLRSLLIGASLAGLLCVGVWLFPARPRSEEVRRTPAFRELERQIGAELAGKARLVSLARTAEYPLTPLVRVRLLVLGVRSGPAAPPARAGASFDIRAFPTLEIRRANLALALTVPLALLLLLWQGPALLARRGDGREAPLAELSAEELLAHEVRAAERQVEQMETRSTLLLAGGLLTGLLGVVAFVLALDGTGAAQTLPQALSRALGPAGMLLFVEMVAWFLLRQSIVSMEHLRDFHRLYLRRASYLATFKLMPRGRDPELDLLLPAALLAEDLSGRLEAGETSEAVEGIKAIEPNPVAQILQSALDVLRKPKA